MSTLRSIRLLNSVEAGLTLGNVTNPGPSLQTFLTDSGRLSEFHVLLAMRGQTRRMAASSVTMQAIIDSEIATDAVFADTDINNTTAALAITKNQTAMTKVSINPSTLNVIGVNPVSWGLFIVSQWYEDNIKNIIANLADLVSEDYTDEEDLITTPSAVSIIVGRKRAMAAVVASSTTSTYMAANATIMAIVADNNSAITIVANSYAVMPIIAASTNAMDEIVTSSTAMPVMASIPNSIIAISKVTAAFNSFLGSIHFAANIKNTICNLIGINPGDFATVDDIINNASALTTVANSSAASKALASSSSAVTTLASSSNLSIILNNAIAMEFFANESIIETFLSVSSSVPVVFGSSIAKGVIVTSNTLVDYLAANELNYLESIMSDKTVPSNLNAPGTNNVFGGIPSKVLTVKMRANNIGAIAAVYTFTGDVVAGISIGATISLSGTVTQTKVMGYTNPKWKVAGIAATAAVSPEWRYIDMS